VFEQRIFSSYGDISWPARSPDMLASCFFLWGCLKIEVFQHVLQAYITSNMEFRINAITPAMLLRAMENILNPGHQS
jgi:hypothetical protein